MDPAASREDRRQEAIGPKFGNLQPDIPLLGGQGAGPVAVAVVEPLLGALVPAGIEDGGGLQLVQILQAMAGPLWNQLLGALSLSLSLAFFPFSPLFSFDPNQLFETPERSRLHGTDGETHPCLASCILLQSPEFDDLVTNLDLPLELFFDEGNIKISDHTSSFKVINKYPSYRVKGRKGFDKITKVQDKSCTWNDGLDHPAG